MTLENIKLGGFTKDELRKIQSNFEKIGTECLTSDDLPDVSGFVTEETLTNALNEKVDKSQGKDLSSNDYTDDDKGKVSNLGKIEFAVSDFGSADSNGFVTATLSAGTKEPVKVMRSNGSMYESVLVDVQKEGTNIKIVSSEAFAGYVLTV